MFKKLLSAAAFALCSLCAFADPGDVIEDFMIDYTTTKWDFYVMGYIPNQDAGWLTVTQTRGSWEWVDGVATYTPNTDADEDGQPDLSWYQLFVAGGISTQAGVDYTVTVYGKADVEADCDMNMQWGWGDGEQIKQQLHFLTEWSEVEATFPEIGGSKCDLVLQPGTQETTFEIKWIKVTHIDNSKPMTWIDILTNGDAEGEYGDVPCCYAKSNVGENAGDPVPAEIVEIDGGHAFICRGGAVDASADGHQWANQLWVVAPRNFTEGETVKISFKYKASANAGSVPSQAHADPGAYLCWYMLGNLNFTTDWQTHGATVTIDNGQAGGGTMHSVAFNLNETYKDACDFYFDDIVWEVTPTEDGWFVAGNYQDGGKEDYDAAEKFWYNEDQFVQEVVVGKENAASVVRISTKKGNDNAFLSNTITCDATAIGDGSDEDNYIEYKKKSAAKINLPFADVWTIRIDEDFGLINFISGDLGNNGINGVEFDVNAPVEYYNLQGVKVNNVLPGQVYIIKQGKSVVKSVVRK